MEFIPENRYQDLIVVDSTKGDEVYEVRVLRKWKVVDPSRSNTLASVDLVFIDIHDVRKKRNSFKYMVDVIGVVTSVTHDKNFFPDGTITESVTFKLNDERMVI
ncbi:hypothetical protein P8452_70992 [Trifolium repens]|nr:hypothetical protein P8452_70992 [Trifolium repens]